VLENWFALKHQPVLIQMIPDIHLITTRRLPSRDCQP
jgi:hypothetical protein